MIKVIVEDYNGDYLCSFDSKEVKNLYNCDIADVDTDENGIKYIRVQLTEDRNE